MQMKQTLDMVNLLDLILTDDHYIDILATNSHLLNNPCHPFYQHECSIVEDNLVSTEDGFEHIHRLIMIERHIPLVDWFEDSQNAENELMALAHVSCSFNVWADVIREEGSESIRSIELDRELLADMGAFNPVFNINGVRVTNPKILEMLDGMLLNIDHADIIQDLLKERFLKVQNMPYTYLVRAVTKVDGVEFSCEDLYRVHSPVALQSEDERLYKSFAYQGVYGCPMDFEKHFNGAENRYTKPFSELELEIPSMAEFEMGITIVRLYVEDYNDSLEDDHYIMHHTLTLDDADAHQLPIAS